MLLNLFVTVKRQEFRFLHYDKSSFYLKFNLSSRLLGLLLQISRTSALGFDAEIFNVNKYTRTTCLLELSIDNTDYILDVFSPGVCSKVLFLIPIFVNPAIIKIWHSIRDMDVQTLIHDFCIFPVDALIPIGQPVYYN